MQRPASAASRGDLVRSALTRHHRNAGSAAAAARLKWPVVRAIIAGDHPKTSPASHASHRFAVGDPARESVHRHGVQHAHHEEDDIERGHDAEPRNQRQCQQIQERRVVVLREIDLRGQRQDFFGGQRIVAGGELLVEYPLIPHVDASIAAGITGKVSPQLQRQGPREGERCHYVADDNGEPGGKRSHGQEGRIFIRLSPNVKLEILAGVQTKGG